MTMMKLVAPLSVVLSAGALSAKEVALAETFPLGAYMSWSASADNAHIAGLSKEDYFDRLAALVKRLNGDTLWIVNGPTDAELPAVLKTAEKRGVGLLLNSKLLKYCYSKFDGDVSRLEKAAADSASRMADSPAFLGYVFKDEPERKLVQPLQAMADIQKSADPKHDAVMVISPRQYRAYVDDTDFPAVAMDIYYFGGPSSQGAIPTPASESRMCYRRGVRHAVSAARRAGKNVWIMPQAFAEVRGPHWWDATFRHCYTFKGSYVHWRMPTAAEIRWQAWEALRAGARGILFFTLHGGYHTEEDIREGGRYRHRYEVRAKRIKPERMSTEDAEIDPARTLTFPGGEPTPQARALGVCFARIAPHRARFLKAKEARRPVVFSDDPMCAVNTFEEKGVRTRLAVVVNDDFEQERSFVLRVPESATSVRDLNGGELALSEASDGFRSFCLGLAAGDGTVVEVSFGNRLAGFCLLDEDFAPERMKEGTLDESLAEIRLCDSWGLRVEYALAFKGPSEKPAYVFEKLTSAAALCERVSFLGINAVDGKEDVPVFVQVEGEGVERGLELLAYSAAEEKEGCVFWKGGDPFPARVPAGTVRVGLRSIKGEPLVRRVRFWFEAP